MLITSPQNPRIKQLIALRERKEREKTNLMIVEGHDELTTALASGSRPHEVYFCPSLSHHSPQNALLKSVSEQQRFEVNERVFEKIAYRNNPDGWLATFRIPHQPLKDLALRPRPLLIISEGVEKPGNLGAMLRTADAAGVDALVACDPLADWGNPNVVRASKGALFTVQVAEASNQETISWLREKGIRIVAATPQAALRHTDADMSGGVAIVVGTEHEGLTDEWLDAADTQVQIPMHGKVNSLNVSIATALLVYEAVRQRG
ncbi:MAG: RNA methyltransferase [Anaerolineae bacterium]